MQCTLLFCTNFLCTCVISTPILPVHDSGNFVQHAGRSIVGGSPLVMPRKKLKNESPADRKARLWVRLYTHHILSYMYGCQLTVMMSNSKTVIQA